MYKFFRCGIFWTLLTSLFLTLKLCRRSWRLIDQPNKYWCIRYLFMFVFKVFKNKSKSRCVCLYIFIVHVAYAVIMCGNVASQTIRSERRSTAFSLLPFWGHCNKKQTSGSIDTWKKCTHFPNILLSQRDELFKRKKLRLRTDVCGYYRLFSGAYSTVPDWI